MSFPPVTYQDLEKSGIPFSSFIMAVDAQPSVVRDWKKRSIPFDHQLLIHNFLVSRGIRCLTILPKTNPIKIKELEQNSIPKNIKKIKYIAKKTKDKHVQTMDYVLSINGLDVDGAPLVTITKRPVNNPKDFLKIQQWKPAPLPKIASKNSNESDDFIFLVFDSPDYRSYIHNVTGEQYDFRRKGKKWLHVKSASEIVSERYELQSIMRDILMTADVPLRACGCHRTMLGADVQVLQSVKHETTFYSGIMSCGMVWQCPVCSPKVSERRRLELKTAFDAHKAAGGVFSFVTRTVPHTNADSLRKVLDQFVSAEAKMREARKYKDLKKLFGVIGTVKCYELTVGKNGWHLHTHEIFFHESQAAVDHAATKLGDKDYIASFEEAMYPIWSYYTQKVGFGEPSRAHGLQVQNGDFAADYIAKYGVEPSQDFWAVDNEMTGYHRKNSRSGLSPFDCLRQFRDTGMSLYANLFFDFAYTMFEKRARQLMWSPGLKKLYSVVEKSDEEIAAEQEDAALLLGRINREQWKVIVSIGKRAYPLNIARELGAEGLKAFLDGINLILSNKHMN